MKIQVYKVAGLFKAYAASNLLATGQNYDLVVANAKIELARSTGKSVESVHLMAA